MKQFPIAIVVLLLTCSVGDAKPRYKIGENGQRFRVYGPLDKLPTPQKPKKIRIRPGTQDRIIDEKGREWLLYPDGIYRPDPCPV
jgi:hypothetical protein